MNGNLAAWAARAHCKAVNNTKPSSGPASSATANPDRQAVRASSGQQPGDPERAARAIVKAVASGTPPHHLLLGKDAFEGAMAKLDELRLDFTAGEAVARGADFPKANATAST